jgi:hypothetical protein
MLKFSDRDGSTWGVPEGRRLADRRRKVRECNNGIMNRGSKDHLSLMMGRISGRNIGKSTPLEMENRVVGSRNGLQW